jgi:hypothetical protein
VAAGVSPTVTRDACRIRGKYIAISLIIEYCAVFGVAQHASTGTLAQHLLYAHTVVEKPHQLFLCVNLLPIVDVDQT